MYWHLRKRICWVNEMVLILTRPIDFYLFISISLFIFAFIYLFLIHGCILWYNNTAFVVYLLQEKILKEQSSTECVVPKRIKDGGNTSQIMT